MSKVFIVDDDAMVAELNRCYIARVPGFECCGIASSLEEAAAVIQEGRLQIDVILLDVYMQQENGLDLLPVIRASGQPIDVIMITSAADRETIQTALHYGAVDYLIKPFQFPRFEEALMNWRHRHRQMTANTRYEQADVDNLIRSSGSADAVDPQRLPKGLTPQTLRTLCQWIDNHHDTEFSTDDLASAVSISRVSCRKYLIWLAEMNILFTSVHYGATGRPVYHYRLQPEFTDLLKQYCQ